MRNRFSKLLSVLLALCMILSMTGFMASAVVSVPTEYYVKYGGTGDGRSYDSPIGTIAGVIRAINADGHAAGDNVTVYLVPTGNEPTKEQLNITKATEGIAAPVKEDTDLGFISFQAPNVAHSATITYTTYDYDAQADNKMIIANGSRVASSNHRDGSAHMYISGPSVFKNLYIIDLRMDGSAWDFYAQSHSLSFENVDFRRTTRSGNDGYTGKSWNNHLFLGNHGTQNNTPSSVSTGYVTFDNADFIYDLYIVSRGEKTGDSIAYIGNDTTTGVVEELYVTNNATAIQHGVSSVIFNNTTINKLLSTKGTPTVDALQIILNNGSSIGSNEAVVTGDLFVLTATDGVILDITETAGTFEVDTDALAYAVAADGKTVYYGEDEISLVPGTWTILPAASVDAIVETLEDPAVTVDKVFKGWDTTVDGIITAIIEDAPVEVDPIYYVKNGGTGNGLSADAPLGSVNDAVVAINAAGYDAEDEVTIYIMNGDAPEGATKAFYFYDVNGNDIQNANAGANAPAIYGRFTYWKKNGGAVPAHSATIVLKPYDTEVETFLAQSDIIGLNTNYTLGGPTVFEGLTILADRMYDRELFANGKDVTITDCLFKYQGASHSNDNSKFSGVVNGHERVQVGGPADKGNFTGSTVRIESPMTTNNTTYGIEITGSFTATYSGNVKVYVDHEDFAGTILWGRAAGTFNNGLSLILNNGTVTNHKVTKKVNNVQVHSDTIVNGGFQVIVNEGATMNELPDTIKADKTWFVTTEGANLDVTDTAGTFAVPEGKVAYVTDAEYAKEILYSVDGLLTLPEGTYTVKFADTLVDIKAAVTPFEDASMKFKGWIDDGAGKLTADYTLTGEAVVYYVQQGATGDGLSLETPGSFATVVEDINKKYGAGDEVTIKVVKAANEADSYTDLSAIALACIKDIPNHTAMLVIESADAENLSWLTTHQSYATSGYISTNVEMTSPLTFKNIKVVDPRMDWYGDFYVNATNFTIGEGVTWYQPTYANNTLTLNGRARMSGIHGGSRSTKTFSTAFTVEFADGANLDQTTNGITLSGYSESGTMTFNEEVNFKFGNSTVPKIIVDNMNGGGALFKKNVNIVLNGTTVGNLLSDGGKTKGTVINGALQIIKNNANVKAQTIADSLKANLYDLTVIGAAELDVTEIAGKYTVPAGVVAIAVDAEGNRYVSSNNMLTVPGAGVYTVYTDYVVENNVIDFYNTVTLDVAALEVTEAADEIFLGWVLADGTAPKAEETEFKAGDKLSAKFIEFDVENEEGTAGDFFIKGAQIRLEAPAGMRYIVEMDNEFYAELTQYSAELVEAEKPHFGTYVIPADLYDSAEHAEVPAYKLYAETDEVTQYTVCLINIKEGSYDRDYTVYGYIDYIDANGVMHTLTTKDYSTSIYDVAKVAVSKGETSEFLTTIIAAVEAE